MKELIVIIDFGGQYSRLIARRVRECGVYCEIKPHTITAYELEKANPYGIIFSGGPNSIYDISSPKFDLKILELGLPILGICYGAQLIANNFGGEVVKHKVKEYGSTSVELVCESDLFNGLPQKFDCWMSHMDTILSVPKNFKIIASSLNCNVAAMQNTEKRIYALQFHPEVSHTEHGTKIFENFLVDVCKCQKKWQLSSFINEKIKEIKDIVGEKKVISALSGGVDSSVAALLVSKALPEQSVCIFVDHGLLRKGEGDEVERVFKRQFSMNLIRVNAKERFFNKLKGVTNPEKKRGIIGEEFIRVFEEESMKIGGVNFLCQGTIYSDVIESGAEQAAVIKSHHNVGGLPVNINFKGILEPLRGLFKDEVIKVGLELGLPSCLLSRQPFPGPGLAIRVIGEITEERLNILREADEIFRKEISYANLNEGINQYFAVLTGIKSVGIKGDFRTYEETIALRAVTTKDFMTAKFARIPYPVLEKISTRIVNEVDGVNRVVFDITSKPPATIEWE
jgi:GMP synthase (glutamine-hydrolysing)